MRLPRKSLSLLALAASVGVNAACMTSFEQSAQLNRNVFVTAQENVAKGIPDEMVGCWVHDGDSTETGYWTVPSSMVLADIGVRSGAAGMPDQGACAAAVEHWTGGIFTLDFAELNPLWAGWGSWSTIIPDNPPTATEYVP